MTKSTLCLCLLDNEIQVYKSNNQTVWDILPIQGEESFLHHNRKDCLKNILQECNQRLNLDTKLEDVTVTILYTVQDYSWLIEVLQQLDSLKNKQAQILHWQGLVEYARKNLVEELPTSLPPEWTAQYILPLTCLENSWQEHQKLINSLNVQKQIQQEQLQAEEQQAQLQAEEQQAQTNFAEQLAKLQAEKQQLLVEVREVQKKIAAVQHPNLEALLSFLPSIFKNFWNTVRPDELANIAGLLNIPNVSSPYHNPTSSAVQAKKRQFQALAEEERQQIIAFCRQLKMDYDLNLHLEFQPIIGALD